MIDSLTEFTVVPGYHRSRTRYDVYAKGSRDPVAQARLDRAPDSLLPLQVFTGPGLDQPAGWVSFTTAIGPDRARIGKVEGRRDPFGKKRTFTQNGLPVLHGTRAGVAGSMRDGLPVAREFLVGGVADMALSGHLKFSARTAPASSSPGRPASGPGTRCASTTTGSVGSWYWPPSCTTTASTTRIPTRGSAISSATRSSTEFLSVS